MLQRNQVSGAGDRFIGPALGGHCYEPARTSRIVSLCHHARRFGPGPAVSVRGRRPVVSPRSSKGAGVAKRSGAGRGPRTRALHGRVDAERGLRAVASPGADGDEEPDLVGDVRETLRASHPLDLLALTSSLLAVLDPRQVDPFAPETPRGPSREELIGSFLDVRLPEISALLGAIAELTDDEVEQRRIRRELADRPHKPPRWLRRLSPPRVVRALEMSHVLGDGDNVLLDVRTGNDDPLTALVYIDHNMGTLVKDAFVVEEPLATLEGRFRELSADEPDTTFVELDLADARARISEAIELAAITYPPLETETWPACRPLVEWVLRHLPEGGTGYVRPHWPEEAREQLVEEFLASPHAPNVPAEEAGDLAFVMVWFACDYGPGDPLRWSTVSVEIFLTDFLVRKALFPQKTLRRAPKVLEAFVRFAHDQRGIRGDLTEQTLASIGHHAHEFRRQLGGEPEEFGQMLAELLADREPGETDFGAAAGFTFDAAGRPVPIAERMRELLIEQVGDEHTLDTLDLEPLPDEPLDLDRLPDDIRERVARIADLTDACCEQLLDVEHRTASRRLLVDVAEADPQIFRRRSRDDTAAAALAWTITKVNDSLEPYHGGLTAKRLLGWFGITGSVSQRAETMLRALGVPHRADTGVRLGTPRYLTADARVSIAERRDRFT